MSMNQDVVCKTCKDNDVQTTGTLQWDQLFGRYEIVEEDDVWYCNTCQRESEVVWLYDWEYEQWVKEAS